MSQELSISDDGKILKLCDLSDKDNVLWIKTYSVSEKDESKENSLARQLHYESNWRNIFAFFVDVDRHINNKGEFVTDVVKGYNINLEEYEPKPIESVRVLWNDEIKILKIIKIVLRFLMRMLLEKLGEPRIALEKLSKHWFTLNI